MHPPVLVFLFFTVVALAGQADRAAVRADAEKALDTKTPDQALAYLALACRRVGLDELGERLAARLKSWDPNPTEDLSLKLVVQVAYGARRIAATSRRIPPSAAPEHV